MKLTILYAKTIKNQTISNMKKIDSFLSTYWMKGTLPH